MKKIITLLTAVTTTLLLTQCKKDNPTYNSYFYTTVNDQDAQLSLYIDNDYKGDLPYLANKPTCENDSLKSKSLFLTLPAGKYKVAAKDKQGNIKSSSTLKIKSGLLESKSGTGGTEVRSSNGCLIVGLFY